MDIAEKVDAFLEQNYSGLTSSIYRDLSLNFKKVLEDGPLEPTERFQNLLAAAVALENQEMMKWSAGLLKEMGMAEDALRETAEIAGIMGMNNVYYKFRSYLPEDVKDSYQRAGLRMQSLAKHIAEKRVFESMAMTVSIVNGCPICVASHEKALTTAGATTDQIHELARIAATATGLSALKKAQIVL